MTPAQRLDAEAHRILGEAVGNGTSAHRAVLKVQVLFAFEAAETFWACVTHAGMDTPALRAAAIDAMEYQAREGVKVCQAWEATAGQPEFDVQVADIIRAAFRTRLDELFCNAQLWGLRQ